MRVLVRHQTRASFRKRFTDSTLSAILTVESREAPPVSRWRLYLACCLAPRLQLWLLGNTLVHFRTPGVIGAGFTCAMESRCKSGMVSKVVDWVG